MARETPFDLALPADEQEAVKKPKSFDYLRLLQEGARQSVGADTSAAGMLY